MTKIYYYLQKVVVHASFQINIKNIKHDEQSLKLISYQ